MTPGGRGVGFPAGRWRVFAVAVWVSGIMIWLRNVKNHIARDYYTATASTTAAAVFLSFLLFSFLTGCLDISLLHTSRVSLLFPTCPF